MPHRLFEYASAAVVAMDLPVSTIVVLLRPGGRPPRGTGVYRVPGVSGNSFVFRYRVVSLWQLDARRMRAYLGPLGAPFCVAMRGADEEFVRSLAAEVRAASELSERDRETTMQLLFLVTAVILGSETAKRIFHMESIIQEPNVQELIREWEDKGHAKGRAEEARANLYRVLALRSLPITRTSTRRSSARRTTGCSRCVRCRSRRTCAFASTAKPTSPASRHGTMPPSPRPRSATCFGPADEDSRGCCREQEEQGSSSEGD